MKDKMTEIQLLKDAIKSFHREIERLVDNAYQQGKIDGMEEIQKLQKEKHE